MKLNLIPRIFIPLILLVLAACGGGGGGGYSGGSSGGTVSSSSSSSSSSVAALTNFTPITVEAGPGNNVNIPFVTVTICLPGTLTCQTIDHIIMDTGSEGLRIEREALNASMLAGLPKTLKPDSTEVGECYQYVDGYVFGSVRTADFTIGGEKVSNLSMMVIGDSGNFASVPSDCSSTGGTSHDTIADFGANGIIGIGLGSIDCGSTCTTTTNNGFYYSCVSTGCTAVTLPTSQQVPNPVAKMAVNNNGTVVDLPVVTGTGVASLSGTLYFGISTQTNNDLGSHTVLTTDNYGNITATYKSNSLSQSFIDSGTNFYGFSDSSITQCTGNLAGFYCPATSLALSANLTGANSVAKLVNFTVDNTQTLVQSPNFVLPGIAGDPAGFSKLAPFSNSFDFGLPFFYGKKVYTAIAGRNAGGTSGPYFAF